MFSIEGIGQSESMARGATVFTVALILSFGVNAFSDEKVPSSDDELDEQNAAPEEDSAAPQAAAVPAIDPVSTPTDNPEDAQRDSTTLTPPPAGNQDTQPAVDPKIIRRRLAEHSRNLVRLNNAVRIEGPDADYEKFRRYRARVAGGVTLIVVGVATFFGGIVVGMAGTIGSVASDFGDHESSGGDGDGILGAMLGMMLGGVACIGAGIPLAISGRRGKSRQQILRRKEEILAPFDPFAVTASVSLFTDSEGNVGGLRLEVRF